MDKIKLEIIGISYSQSQTGAYALILGEVNGARRLPIVIGGFEAQAIAIELEKMKPSRPLTHDLFKNFAMEFNIAIAEVMIYKFADGVFFSKLECEGLEKSCVIDSRTSDAVALAVRFNCPIFTNENVMSVAGVVLEESKELSEDTNIDDIQLPSNDITGYAGNTLAELDDLLQSAVEDEDYERASAIRDEIKKRK